MIVLYSFVSYRGGVRFNSGRDIFDRGWCRSIFLFLFGAFIKEVLELMAFGGWVFGVTVGGAMVNTVALLNFFGKVWNFECIIEDCFSYASLSVFVFVNGLYGRCVGRVGWWVGFVFVGGLVVGVMRSLLASKAEDLTCRFNQLDDGNWLLFNWEVMIVKLPNDICKFWA